MHYLVAGANGVRRLVRIKIADDNDLEQARVALVTTMTFFKRLQAEAAKVIHPLSYRLFFCIHTHILTAILLLFIVMPFRQALPLSNCLCRENNQPNWTRLDTIRSILHHLFLLFQKEQPILSRQTLWSFDDLCLQYYYLYVFYLFFIAIKCVCVFVFPSRKGYY